MTELLATSNGKRSDEELLLDLSRGKNAGLGELYRRHAGTVRVTIGRFAPEISAAECDELVQETFLTLGRTAARFRSDAKFRPWLFGIAVRVARHWRRDTWLHRQLLRQQSDQPVGIALRTEGSPARTAELRETLAQLVERLPRNQREVLMLCAVEGFSGEEAAQILKISHRAVRTRMHRARKTLLRATQLSERGEREGER